MANAFSLSEKKILITGASSGIGLASADLFSKSGASLFLNGRNQNRLKAAAAMCSGPALALPSDISNLTGVRELVDSIDSPLDGIFMCAGITINSLIKFSNESDIEKIFDTNCFSAMRILRELITAKKLKRGASIVITASVAGVLANPGHFLYGSSKAALIEFAKEAAVELAPRKIRVNTISPGLVDTPMTAEFINSEPELCAADKRKYLLGYGEACDVAYAAQYLLSDASRWVTGTNLIIDGGYTCHK